MTDRRQSRICLIPARGGSKRLPRKNVLPFEGKPMLAWSIECAFESGLFERVIVSTEDEEIGRTAEAWGALWDRRPDDLATDNKTVADVCSHFIERETAEGRNYDILVVLYATAPMRHVEDVRGVVDLVEQEGADFALTATDYAKSPAKALAVEDDQTARLAWPDLAKRHRYDPPNFKVDVGSVYAVRVSKFMEHKGWYGPNLKILAIPPERAVDINTQDDFDLAQYYARKLSGDARSAG